MIGRSSVPLAEESMRTHRRAGLGAIELLAVLAALGFLLGLILGGINQARNSANRITSINNMRNIGLAIHNYDSAAGQLPESNDKNHFSVLVQILDLVGDGEDGKGIDRDRPVTDKANAEARKRQIKYFLSPDDPQARVSDDLGATNYFFCAGSKPTLKDNNGAFAEGAKVSLDAISNGTGTGKTIFLVESLKGDGGKKAVDVRRQHVALKKDALKDIKDEAGVSDFKDGKNIASNRGASWMDGRFLQTTFTATRVPDDPRPDVDCEGLGGLSAPRSIIGKTIPVLFADNHVQRMPVQKIKLDIWQKMSSVKGDGKFQVPD